MEKKTEEMMLEMDKPLNGEVTACFLVPMVAGGVMEVCMVSTVSYACGALAIAA